MIIKLLKYLYFLQRQNAKPQGKLEQLEMAEEPPASFTQNLSLEKLINKWIDLNLEQMLTPYLTALGNWQNRRQSSFALVGFNGQGRNKVLARLTSEQGVEPLCCPVKVTNKKDFQGIIAPNGLNDKDDLVSYLDSTRKILVLEDCQNLMLKTVGGFEALNEFLRIMSATWDRVFWVTSWERTSWLYLEEIMDIGKFFTTVVYLRPVESEQLQGLIEGMIAELGYGVQHDEGFFGELAAENRGLLSACYYWLLKEARLVKERKILFNQPQYRIEGIDKLNERETYALVSLIQNDGLDASLLSLVINEEPAVCEQILEKLMRMNLCTIRKGIYSINPAILPQIFDYLEKQRYVYLAY